MTDRSLPAYFGRYQVLEELGAGAMGVVYLCVDPRLTRPVAVKVLRESEHMTLPEKEQYRARFRHEAEAAGRLSHPDIVQIYDIGPAYIVMEFIEGRTFSTLLRAGGGLTAREVTSLVVRVADAIDYAHRHGIVHRDVKPGNIMVTGDGGVKVMDFGVARLESSTLTVAGTVVGSVRYMAPEQMMGLKVDGRADVFSLAAVAYELLTARAPFPGKTVTEVVTRVVHGDHVPPRQADERLPEAVNSVFARAFAPKPEERYPRAMEFARDLQEVLGPVGELAIAYKGEDASPTSVVQAATVKGVAAPVVPVRQPQRPGPPAGPSPGGREGVVMLDSEPPGAWIWLDGSPVGQAPVANLGVTFGRHVVRMEAPGGGAVSAEIDVRPERPVQAVTFSLPPPDSDDGSVRPGQLVPFGPDVTPPTRVSGRVPSYPEAARERGLEGSPVVEVWVSETGEVIDVAMVESAGATLDAALLEAVAGWRFTPPSYRGVPVSLRLTVRHVFRR